MNKRSDEEFILESFILMNSISGFFDHSIKELRPLYKDSFKKIFEDTISLLNVASVRISRFVDKWENDDYNICNTLKTINEYISYYCTCLKQSDERFFMRDSGYIIDSMNTAKLGLKNKIKKINGRFNKL